jgi:integrase
MALSEFGERFLEYAKANKRSWLRDEQMLKHLNGFFGQAMLTDITPVRIERYKLERIKQVSPATVNRELALLKHMFNTADKWDLFRGSNPVRRVRFFSEDNLQYRSLSEAEEEALLKCCSPYLQDLAVFAINTGLRLGDILKLKWEEVDLERNVLTLVPRKPKHRRVLELPLNERAEAFVCAWWGMRKCSYVFYNPETGDHFKDLWLEGSRRHAARPVSKA